MMNMQCDILIENAEFELFLLIDVESYQDYVSFPMGDTLPDVVLFAPLSPTQLCKALIGASGLMKSLHLVLMSM